MEAPQPGDWLAVLIGDREAGLAVIEVVSIHGNKVEGFMLFPDDGAPVRVALDRCLEFVRPQGVYRVW